MATRNKTGDVLNLEEQALLRRTKCATLTADQFQEFIHAVNRHCLDPFSNQIHAVTRNTNVGTREAPKWEKRLTVQTGIDGFRLIADRTGVYAGNDDAACTYDDKSGLVSATGVVYKVVGGQRCAFAATARWTEYHPGQKQGRMWTKMPHVMLAKCAEALALRKAFPAELSGLYTNEEMQQADRDTLPTTEPQKPKASAPSQDARTKTLTWVAQKRSGYGHTTDHEAFLQRVVTTLYPGSTDLPVEKWRVVFATLSAGKVFDWATGERIPEPARAALAYTGENE